MTDDVVVMLSALNLEYDAVRRMLSDVDVCHERGTRFEVGKLPGTKCRVALGLTSKGNQSAAVLTERAMQRFDPAAVLFVGVAGALRAATPLADVVMATHVYAYHGGTSDDDGLRARPRVWETAHGISQLAAHLGRTGEWTANAVPGDRTPDVHFGAIAAGEIVLNSRISYEATWLRDHYNDALAIEMESSGVAQAGHLNGVPVGIVRGISDRADGTKNSDADGTWQPRAAANAAAFATRLAGELINERESTSMREDRTPKHGTVVTNTNTSSGQVGIQAATVTGSIVNVGSPPKAPAATDLVTELAAFREQLDEEHAAGTVDDPTYEAAQAELDIAGGALESDSQDGKGTVVVALKRLRGLIGDIANLATVATTLITAANGLS